MNDIESQIRAARYTTLGQQAKMAKTKIGRNAPCPCGSGAKYKRCCGKPRSVTPAPTPSLPRYPRSPRRRVQLAGARATDTALREAQVSQDEILAAMERANVRPAIIFAYQRTGMWITEINRTVHSEEELAAWDGAIDKYQQQHPEEENAEDGQYEESTGDQCAMAEDPPGGQEADEGEAGRRSE